MSALQLLLLSFVVAIGLAQAYDPPLVPEDAPQCAKFRGRMSRMTSRVRQRFCGRCPCSCNPTCARKTERLHSCCRKLGVSSECMPGCKFNVDQKFIKCNAEKCGAHFFKWIGCLAEGVTTQEGLKCCRNRGLANCDAVCGHTMKTARDIIPNWQCFNSGNKITRCAYDKSPDSKNTNLKHSNKKFPENANFTSNDKILLGIFADEC